MIPFNSESHMCDALLQSEDFFSFFNSETNVLIAKELKGYFGIPDLMVFDLNEENLSKKVKKAVAIELKLTNWRRAIEQSYRYKAFSDLSLVCIDAANINPALMHLDYFKKFRIGLLSFSVYGKLESLYIPPYEPPYSSILREKLENENFLQFLSVDDLCPANCQFC